jgi:hypothetical protein
LLGLSVWLLAAPSTYAQSPDAFSTSGTYIAPVEFQSENGRGRGLNSQAAWDDSQYGLERQRFLRTLAIKINNRWQAGDHRKLPNAVVHFAHGEWTVETSETPDAEPDLAIFTIDMPSQYRAFVQDVFNREIPLGLQYNQARQHLDSYEYEGLSELFDRRQAVLNKWSRDRLQAADLVRKSLFGAVIPRGEFDAVFTFNPWTYQQRDFSLAAPPTSPVAKPKPPAVARSMDLRKRNRSKAIEFGYCWIEEYRGLGDPLDQVARQIAEHWTRTKRHGGQVYVTFKLHSNGFVSHLRLDYSMNACLKSRREALRAIETAAPFLSLPKPFPRYVDLAFCFDSTIVEPEPVTIALSHATNEVLQPAPLRMLHRPMYSVSVSSSPRLKRG